MFPLLFLLYISSFILPIFSLFPYFPSSHSITSVIQPHFTIFSFTSVFFPALHFQPFFPPDIFSILTIIFSYVIYVYIYIYIYIYVLSLSHFLIFFLRFFLSIPSHFVFHVPLLSFAVIFNFLHFDCLFASHFPMRFPFSPPCSLLGCVFNTKKCLGVKGKGPSFVGHFFLIPIRILFFHLDTFAKYLIPFILLRL